MYQRRLKKALDPRDVQELIAAELFAEKGAKKLNTVITVHPKLLDKQPTDLGRWVSWLTNKIRIFCERDRRFGYFALWVRENYEGDAREHVHMLIYVPDRHKAELERALVRWLPGNPRAVKLTKPQYDFGRRDQWNRPVNKALTYLLKQMTPQAYRSLENWRVPVRREARCRKTDAPVAAVLGKRCGVSRSLNRKARRVLRQPDQRATDMCQVVTTLAVAGV